VPRAPAVEYESKPLAARIPSRFFDSKTSLMLPIPVENFVTLYLASTESVDGWLVGFQRNLSDGTHDAAIDHWLVPVNHALVVTGVDWQYRHDSGAGAAGFRQSFRLLVQNIAEPEKLEGMFCSTIILGSQGEGGISEALSTGFVVSDKGRLVAETFGYLASPGLSEVYVRGYLIHCDSRHPGE
jgi:hypothetical protein